MELFEMNPLVRYINTVSYYLHYPEPVLAYDFRMLYVVQGSLTVETQDSVFTLCPGDLLTLPPALAYRLEYEQTEKICYYISNFDFMGNWEMTVAQAPEVAQQFECEKVFSFEAPEQFLVPFLFRNATFAETLLVQINQAKGEIALQSALMKQLLVQISRGKTASENELVQRVKAYIQAHCTEEINNETVAKHFGYHPYYLNTAFFKSEGITLHKHIERMRTLRAGELLVQTKKSIAEIAEDCGFKDASYFCKFFARHMKMTPKQYRKLVK